jgi:hypothetical protein
MMLDVTEHERAVKRIAVNVAVSAKLAYAWEKWTDVHCVVVVV